MGETVYEDSGLNVTRLLGPAGPADRRLWQLTTTNRAGYVQLTRGELDRLVAALSRELTQ